MENEQRTALDDIVHESTETQNYIRKDERLNGSDQSSEDDQPPLQVNHEALKHIATYFMPGNHGKCTNITPFSSGGYHHIELLEFEDGWSCIGRLAYEHDQPLGMDEAGVATMQYVSRHTTIPVPEIYFVNHNHNHVVGAAFVLMERVPGTILWDLWNELSFSHKKSVLTQIAGVATQLASLKFDQIGSLTTSGGIGPLFQQGLSTHNGPFDTLEDAFNGMVDASPSASCCAECQEYCQKIRTEIQKFFARHSLVHPLCKAPYALQHADFTAGNILFEQEDPDKAPVLTGLIDFDGSGTGPVYYQYDHSGLLITDDWREPEYYAINKQLRKHYVRALASHFPRGSTERKHVHWCFRMKAHFLDQFVQVFPQYSTDHDDQQGQMKLLVTQCQKGIGAKRDDDAFKWSPDTDSELDDTEEDSESSSEGRSEDHDEEDCEICGSE